MPVAKNSQILLKWSLNAEGTAEHDPEHFHIWKDEDVWKSIE